MPNLNTISRYETYSKDGKLDYITKYMQGFFGHHVIRTLNPGDLQINVSSIHFWCQIQKQGSCHENLSKGRNPWHFGQQGGCGGECIHLLIRDAKKRFSSLTFAQKSSWVWTKTFRIYFWATSKISNAPPAPYHFRSICIRRKAPIL